MPEHVVAQGIADQNVQSVVQAAQSAMERSKRLGGDVRDALKEMLVGRYEVGREVENAYRSQDELNQKEFCGQVAKRLSCSSSHVKHHIYFTRACHREFSTRDHPGEAYVERQEEEEGQLTWTAAIQWAYSDSDDAEEEEETSERERLMRKVERLAQRLDETVSELEERAGSDESARSIMEMGAQEVNDAAARLERLPESGPERVRDNDYLEWVAGHACCACGVDDDTVVPHHLREFIAETGIAIKPSDLETVPLCFDCHQRLEDGDSLGFWENTAVNNPLALARGLNALRFREERR